MNAGSHGTDFVPWAFYDRNIANGAIYAPAKSANLLDTQLA